IESHSLTIDERGLTSESQTCYGDTLMERLKTSTVPTSDQVATATVVDGLTTAQTDQLGGTYSYTREYTETGITSTVTDPRGNTVTQKTDIAGRAIEQIDAAGNSTHTTYCTDSDNLASITDALGNVITYSYDLRGRKIAENGTGIYPATYSYDDADRMISHSTYRDDQADTTSYCYDAATGFLLSTTYADGTAETRSYNTMNLLGHLYNARGADCIHTYNTLTGDLLKQNYTDDTTDITYTYNHLGQVTSITDAAGTRTFAYNEYSELESDTSAIDTTNIQVAESYDEMGRSNGYRFIKGSENVQIVAQSYDSKGRIGSASFIHSGESKDFTYNYIEGTSLLQSLVHPNGITTTNTYEASRNLITDINDSRSTTSVVERGYSYDELGRPITRRIARKGTVSNDSFSYDTKSQLTAATMGSDDYAYDYDNIGNRKTAQEIADEITYDANELNQYTTISDFTPEFDLDGNQTKLQTSTGIWNVSYNAANRPTIFTSEDGNTVIECSYDSVGRRVTKKVTTNGSVTLNQRYVYRGYLQIAALDLTRSTLNALHIITWNPAEQTATRPLALQISGTWFTYGLDLSKNVTELFTTAGGVETCYTYSPFGAATEDGDTTSPIQWSSEVYDSELALVYYNYRHYNPADGRWINRDPIGIEGGMNLYGFVKNSAPINIDEKGLFLDTVWDVGSILWDVGVVATGIIKDDSQMVEDGLIDLAADTAAALIPFVPAGSTKVIRGAKSATKATKETSEIALKNKRMLEKIQNRKGRARGHKGCCPCKPPVGSLGHQIAGKRIRGAHKNDDIGHVKVWVMLQTQPPKCECKFGFIGTLEQTTTPPNDSKLYEKDPSKEPLAQYGGGPSPN
ncbi:MAG: RHS repeat-associated core domain-containing protein, partial [Rikenellaceae bacterium]